MKLNLKNIYSFFFFIGIFFIPFNSFDGVDFLGEFRKESAAFFLILGFLVLCIEIFMKRRVVFLYKDFIFQLLFFFLIWCFIATVFNFPTINEYFFKKTTGVNRFFRQYFSILLSCIFFFLLYLNVIFKMTFKEVLEKIRSVFLYSFIAVSIYGFFEIIYNVFNIRIAYLILRLFDYFPFTEYDYDINGRISSVCYEAPSLAIYLITVSGWMFSYILTHDNYKKYIPMIIVLTLTYYSGSRTALIVVSVQAIVFLFLVFNLNQIFNRMKYIFILFSFFLAILLGINGDKIFNDFERKIESLDFVGNMKNNISNQSRFGIQYANLIVFANHPIIGIGFGQQAFEAVHYYPAWSRKNNYEFDQIYLNKKDPMFPPGYNLYIRLLAETGLIGFSIFICFIYFILKRTRQLINTNRDERRTLAIIILITTIGLSINWLQVDFFRVYGFWLCLAILFRITPLNKPVKIDEK